jgi:hypothetical protein
VFAGLAGVLIACGTELSTPGEMLRFVPQTPVPALVNEPYNQNLPVAGGLSPYAYTVSQGSLPPGLTLQGGFIRGVPSETGSYSFTVEVSDANLSVRTREISLEVVEPPPPVLTLNVPETEMREPFVVRAEVAEAREVMALRTELRWDTGRFELNEASIRALQNNVALFHSFEDGILRLDMALLEGASLSGRQPVFELELVPLEPSTIQLESRTEFHRLSGAHAFSRELAGLSPTEPAAEQDEDPADLDPDLDPDSDPDEDPDETGGDQ